MLLPPAVLGAYLCAHPPLTALPAGLRGGGIFCCSFFLSLTLYPIQLCLENFLFGAQRMWISNITKITRAKRVSPSHSQKPKAKSLPHPKESGDISRAGILRCWAVIEEGTFGTWKGAAEGRTGDSVCSSYLCPSTRQAVQHFTFYGCPVVGAHLPQQAHTDLSAQRGEKQGVPSTSSQWEERQGWWHAREPPSQPACRLDGSMAFPARLGLLPALGRFHRLIPFAKAQLITPKSGAKTTGDHSSCLCLPPLSLVISWSMETW